MKKNINMSVEKLLTKLEEYNKLCEELKNLTKQYESKPQDKNFDEKYEELKQKFSITENEIVLLKEQSKLFVNI